MVGTSLVEWMMPMRMPTDATAKVDRVAVCGSKPLGRTDPQCQATIVTSKHEALLASRQRVPATLRFF